MFYFWFIGFYICALSPFMLSDFTITTWCILYYTLLLLLYGGDRHLTVCREWQQMTPQIVQRFLLINRETTEDEVHRNINRWTFPTDEDRSKLIGSRDGLCIILKTRKNNKLINIKGHLGKFLTTFWLPKKNNEYSSLYRFRIFSLIRIYNRNKALQVHFILWFFIIIIIWSYH